MLTSAGLNVQYLMYQDLVEKKKIAPLTSHKKNVYWIDIYADIINFLFRNRGMRWTFKDYVYPYKQDKTFCVWNENDMKPFIFQLIMLPAKYMRSLKGKLKLKENL